MEKKRIYYIDVLRCLACLCVVMIHVSEHAVYYEHTETQFFISGVLDALSRIGVPLFFMISGALFLEESKNYDFKKMTKHIINIIIVFVAWSFISCFCLDYLIFVVSKVEVPPVSYIIRDFIQGFDVLWFLKAIIGLYLLVPVLRLWVKKENEKYIKYFLIVSTIINILIPTIGFISSKYYYHMELIDANISFFTTSSCFLTYFILGWYLHNFPIKHKITTYIMGCISLILTVFFFILLSKKTTDYIEMMGVQSIFIFIQSFAAYIFFKEINYKKEIKIVKGISKHSLGIYVSHYIALRFLLKLEKFIPFISNYYLLRIAYLYIFTLLMAYSCSYIIGKIPYVKKIVNL